MGFRVPLRKKLYLRWPMLFGDRWGLSFLTFCLTVEEKTSTRKADPIGDRTQTRWVREQRCHLLTTAVVN